MIGGVTRHMLFTSPIWGPPPPCKQAFKKYNKLENYLHFHDKITN